MSDSLRQRRPLHASSPNTNINSWRAWQACSLLPRQPWPERSRSVPLSLASPCNWCEPAASPYRRLPARGVPMLRSWRQPLTWSSLGSGLQSPRSSRKKAATPACKRTRNDRARVLLNDDSLRFFLFFFSLHGSLWLPTFWNQRAPNGRSLYTCALLLSGSHQSTRSHSFTGTSAIFCASPTTAAATHHCRPRGTSRGASVAGEPRTRPRTALPPRRRQRHRCR